MKAWRRSGKSTRASRTPPSFAVVAVTDQGSAILIAPTPFPPGQWDAWEWQISMNSWADWDHLHSWGTVARPQETLPRTDVWAGQVIKVRCRLVTGGDYGQWTESGPIDLE